MRFDQFRGILSTGDFVPVDFVFGGFCPDHELMICVNYGEWECTKVITKAVSLEKKVDNDHYRRIFRLIQSKNLELRKYKVRVS